MSNFKLQVVQLGSPRLPGEGLRVGTVRRPPRGIVKEDYADLDYFDIWLPVLAPSQQLMSSFQNSPMTFDTFISRYRSEMKKTDARQVIQLVAEMAKRTPISIGCYCASESFCHRSILADLVVQQACPISILADTCIYTIAHPEKLAEWTKAGEGELQEKKGWTTGKKLLAEAKKNKQTVALLLADSTDCSRLTHWAIVKQIKIGPKGTKCTFHSVKAFDRIHQPQELTLASTNRRIAEDFIRPYAICQTPYFVRALDG